MTVSSLKKTNNTNSNNNTNASNDNNVSSSQAVLEQQAQQQTTNVDLGSSITDEHHHVNTSRREENDGNVASSNSMPVTTSIINDSSLTNATSLSCSVHPKPKSHYRRPNVIQTNSKHMQRHFTAQEEKFRTSSHSDSSDDDDDDDDDADDDDDPFVSDFKPTYNSPNRSKLKTSQRSNSPDLYNSEDEHEKNATKQMKNRSDDLEMRFVRTLKEKKGYTIKPVKEDGACLFRAVADQVFGDEDMHDTVRQHCMNYIQQNDDFFRAYITEDFNHYVTRKRRNSCHGNHIEIIALSELYNRPIEVYEYSSEPINVVHGMYRTDNEPIRLSYHSGVHYNSIIDPWRPTAGLGLGLPDLRPGDAQQNIIDNAIQQSEESHIDTTVLNDKLTETDLDATQQEILEEITRQSYFDWVQNKNPQSNENSMVSCSNSRATTSHEHFDFDDESLMEQMLALSTMEYIESLTK